MFGRRLLLSTFILAVIFASTVYSKICYIGTEQIPCDPCEAMPAEEKARYNKIAADQGLPPHCVPEVGDGAESIGYCLGLMVTAFFANVFRQ